MADTLNIAPMLATASTGASNRAPVLVQPLLAKGWVLDTKLDGIRAWWRADRLLNRRGVDITRKFPEVAAHLSAVAADGWLDGEIVSLDGKFETVAARDKAEQAVRIKRGAEAHPCAFIAFDLPGMGKAPWTERRDRLEQLATDVLDTSPVGYDTEFLDQVRALGLEGVIAKRPEARYQFGKRSPDWIKFKFTHRVSCLAAGYEPGTGSRAHFGAMHLALIGKDGQIVPVGKVGSGFTERQTWDLKARLDRAEILVVEIEALNVTSGGTLRFPVFRGIRSDVAPTDCLTSQLDQLPTSASTTAFHDSL